jgi:hypothetical protein
METKVHSLAYLNNITDTVLLNIARKVGDLVHYRIFCLFCSPLSLPQYFVDINTAVAVYWISFLLRVR